MSCVWAYMSDRVIWDELVGRLTGPMWLRFIIQPMVSATLAIRAGVRDARAGRPAFLWSLLSDPHLRRQHLLSGWRDVGVLFCVALTLDVVYQLGVLRFLYPVQALAIAGMLGLGPYLICRGLATRVARWYGGRSGSPLFRGKPG
jgi:hypothetical protein